MMNNPQSKKEEVNSNGIETLRGKGVAHWNTNHNSEDKRYLDDIVLPYIYYQQVQIDKILPSSSISL